MPLHKGGRKLRDLQAVERRNSWPYTFGIQFPIIIFMLPSPSTWHDKKSAC